MNVDQRLRTERLYLRGLLAADKPFIHDLITDEAVRRFLGGPVPAEHRGAAVSNYFTPESEEVVWLIQTKDTLRSIGLVSLSNHKDGTGIELSYQFTPDVWGLGYAIEATQRVLDHAMNDLGLGCLIAETQSENKASCRLLERLGMTETRRVQRFGAEQVIYAYCKGDG